MDNIRFSPSGEKRPFIQTFTNPAIETEYRKMRASREMSMLPHILLIAFLATTFIRRLQLLVLSYFGNTVSSFSDELIVFTVAFLALTVEVVNNVCDRLAFLRCVFMTLVSFYSAADGAITYYRSRVKDEPTFAYRYRLVLKLL